MSTCNKLDLQTLGSQPIMPKNLPGHSCKVKYFDAQIRETLLYN